MSSVASFSTSSTDDPGTASAPSFCWVAIDIHTDHVQHWTMPNWWAEPRKGRVFEPNAFTKSILSSIKSFRSLRPAQPFRQISDFAAIFGFIRALVCHQCHSSTVREMALHAVVVVPNNATEPYLVALEEAAKSAGFAQLHFVCRGTAAAIGYRILYQEEDDELLARMRENSAVEREAEEVIVQVDEDEDAEEEKFVAILHADHSFIELTIFDFQSHHMPTLIAAKSLYCADRQVLLEKAPKFLRKQLELYRANLFKLYMTGAVADSEKIGQIAKRLIGPSCQLMPHDVIPPESSVIFGAALKAVDLHYNSMQQACGSPLFLQRALLPEFCMQDGDDGGGLEESDGQDSDQEESATDRRAIDESFRMAFGLAMPQQADQELEPKTAKIVRIPKSEAQDEAGSEHVQQQNASKSEQIGDLNPQNNAFDLLDAEIFPIGGMENGQQRQQKFTEEELRMLAGLISGPAEGQRNTETPETETALSSAAEQVDNTTSGTDYSHLRRPSSTSTARLMVDEFNGLQSVDSDGQAESVVDHGGGASSKMRWEETDDEDNDDQQQDEVQTLESDNQSEVVGQEPKQIPVEQQQTQIPGSSNRKQEEKEYTGPVNEWGQRLDEPWDTVTYEGRGRVEPSKKGNKMRRNYATRQSAGASIAFPFPPPLPAHTMALDAQMEAQFYEDLPAQGRGPLSTVMVLGLPLRWIVNKYFQQEFKEWLRTRAGVQSKALISAYISMSVSASGAYKICNDRRFRYAPFNGQHNGLFLYVLLPTSQVASHLCWACNQIADDLGKYWPNKYGQCPFTTNMVMATHQTVMDPSYA